MDELIKKRWKRLGFALSGISLIFVTFYQINIATQKNKVLTDGRLTEAIVSSIETDGKGYSEVIYVRLNNQEYYIGSNFGKYNKDDLSIGDKVNVYHIEEVPYLVIEGITSFNGHYFIAFITGVFGLICLSAIFFYKEKKLVYKPVFEIKKGKLNQGKVRKWLIHAFPDEKKVAKYGKESIVQIGKELLRIYKELPETVLKIVDEAYVNKDFRLEYIFDVLCEDAAFNEQHFIRYFRKTLSYISKTKDEFYYDVLQSFVFSSCAEIGDYNSEMINILENSRIRLPNDDIRLDELQNELLECQAKL